MSVRRLLKSPCKICFIRSSCTSSSRLMSIPRRKTYELTASPMPVYCKQISSAIILTSQHDQWLQGELAKQDAFADDDVIEPTSLVSDKLDANFCKLDGAGL